MSPYLKAGHLPAALTHPHPEDICLLSDMKQTMKRSLYHLLTILLVYGAVWDAVVALYCQQGLVSGEFLRCIIRGIHFELNKQ